MAKVMITPSVLRDEQGEPAHILRAAGLEVRFPSVSGRQLTEADLMRDLDGMEATVAGPEPYTAAVLRAFPSLRVIARAGVGYDAVDVAAASERGIAIGITPGANHGAVAEHAFALLLGVTRLVLTNHQLVTSLEFGRKIMRPLRGTTLGIVGLGRIGRAVAQRALAFEMTVLSYDPFMPTGGVAAPGVRLVDWETLLRESDVISLHAPLTAETQRLIRAESIATMKDGVILINTARGGLVDEADLAAALASGKVGAAGLDVFVNEPPIGSPLLGAPNVLFSPHVASLDHEGLRQMANMAAQTVADLYQGRWPAERIVNGQSLGPNWSWRANQSASSAARG